MDEEERMHADPVLVRNVDRDVWRRVKAAAALEGKTLGVLLTEILREWLARQKG